MGLRSVPDTKRDWPRYRRSNINSRPILFQSETREEQSDALLSQRACTERSKTAHVEEKPPVAKQ
jgi:hypothetical protein